MARAGKKTLWEDDVRQLLGMPKPESAALAADTSLEKAFGMGNQKPSKKMSARNDGKTYETLEEGSGFRVSGKLVITGFLFLLVAGGVVMIIEEFGQASRSGVAGAAVGGGSVIRRGRSSAKALMDSVGMPDVAGGGEHDEPVSRSNWKGLQSKADAERSKEIAMQKVGTLRGASRHPRRPALTEVNAGSDADAQTDSYTSRGAGADGGKTDGDNGISAGARGGAHARAGAAAPPPGGWASKNGGKPHSGAKTQGEYGAGIFNWA